MEIGNMPIHMSAHDDSYALLVGRGIEEHDHVQGRLVPVEQLEIFEVDSVNGFDAEVAEQNDEPEELEDPVPHVR